jgi:hypothetical protein
MALFSFMIFSTSRVRFCERAVVGLDEEKRRYVCECVTRLRVADEVEHSRLHRINDRAINHAPLNI